MKYLAHFLPSIELTDLILKQGRLILPSSGLNTTLCNFRMSPEKEKGLIYELDKIDYNPFEVKTIKFDDFDKDSLVLRLSNPPGLQRLHKNIVAAFGRHADSSFDEIRKKYYGDNYRPHLTISRSSSGFDRTSKDLIGQKTLVKGYSLSKKLNGIWRLIENFDSAS